MDDARPSRAPIVEACTERCCASAEHAWSGSIQGRQPELPLSSRREHKKHHCARVEVHGERVEIPGRWSGSRTSSPSLGGATSLPESREVSIERCSRGRGWGSSDVVAARSLTRSVATPRERHEDCTHFSQSRSRVVHHELAPDPAVKRVS